MTGPDPTSIIPPDGPAPVPPRWRSAPAAALLNLTGLGLGYVHLERRRRALVAAAVTVVLVAVAFATNAASTPGPWRVLAVVVPAVAAVDGWRLARARGRGAPVPDRRARIRPAAVALAAVVALAAAYLGYGAVGRSVFAGARADQARADCPRAVRGFDLVTGIFELTLSRDVPAAAALRAECTAFLAAQQAEDQRRYADAVTGYRDLRTAHPQSVLVPFASDDLHRTYDAWASTLRNARQFDQAIGVYRDLLADLGTGAGAAQARTDLAATYLERSADTRAQLGATSAAPSLNLIGSAVSDLLVVSKEFPDTPAAATVPGALRDTYAAATTALREQRYCDALPALKYLVGLLPAGVGDLVGTARADHARSLLECGLGDFRAGRPGDAIDPLTELATDYPDDPGTPQARSAVIAAKVGQQTGLPVTLPAPLGNDSPGAIPTTYYNDSPYEITVRVAGATAHEFVIPACTGCPTYGLLDDGPSCKYGSRSPSHTIYLRPGDYVSAATAPSEVDLDANDDKARTEQSGYRYWSCFYVTSPLGGATIGPI